VSGYRIALVDHDAGANSRGLADALQRAGHDARLVAHRGVPAAEALARRRGFTAGLSSVPQAVLELRRGDFDIAHAFSAPDAAAAFVWRRAAGGPVVFTCTESLGRGTVADGRLRLATLAKAIEDSDALAAASEEVRSAVERWFARSPPVIPPDDADAYLRLYGAALEHKGG
jgi:hypothetical protein